MADYRQDLLKAASIAKIRLSDEETAKLVPEIEEALKVFEKIDAFKDAVDEERIGSRHLREDKAVKSAVDTLSNSKFIRDRKFIAPKLVD
jgi:Asp-tRNA(Asn)/Glu-tRNA(Gln) amidotransferase C subunit